MYRTRKQVLGFVHKPVQQTADPPPHPGELHILNTIARGGSVDEVNGAFEEVTAVRGFMGFFSPSLVSNLYFKNCCVFWHSLRQPSSQ